MPLSLAGRPDRGRAKAVVRRAIELGVTLLDTADAYCLDDADTGHNEALIGEALRDLGLRADGPELVVATKGGMTRPGGRWVRDGRPEHLRSACHASLKSLGVERISLYQFHSPDPQVDFAESIGELTRLQAEGKIESIGVSNVSVAQLEIARSICRVASVQNFLSAWDVGFRRSPVLSRCTVLEIPFLAYSPLGGADKAGALGASVALRTLAGELGTTPQELALAWALTESPYVVVIPGASRTTSIESSVHAGTLNLDAQTRRRLVRALRSLPGSEGPVRRVMRRVARWGGR
jgi:aryl-alcohol dehydrogenase-like predicted oxidoreductase